jgi:hypothetical protein
MAKELYGGPVNKHQQLAQTGHAEGYAKGGSVHHSSGGHTSMKHHEQHHGHGTHGHRGPHEHHTSPGSGHTGHKGHDGSVHSFVHEGKNPQEHMMGTHTGDISAGSGHHSGSGGNGTGSTRNRI